MILRTFAVALVLLAPFAIAQQARPGRIYLPYPYLKLCAQLPAGACRKPRITREHLVAINEVVTASIKTVEDPSPLDPWTPFPPGETGDCDDQVATEWATLLAFGMSPDALSIEAGVATDADGAAANHLVLVVTLDDGARWVMDRKTPTTVYPPDDRPYDWRPTATQDHASPLWRIER